MKHISEIDYKPTRSRTIEKESTQVIDDLFIILKRLFPAWKTAITSDHEEIEIKREWMKALVQEKINTMEQIKKGIAKARTYDKPFWPSVGQFIGWCKEQQRINEAAYQRPAVLDALPRHTSEEFKEWAKKGLEKCRKGIVD